ncbi:MAG: hypothetical protein RLY61_149, partial [Candidatus Parcubacteria bacterium]
RVADALDMTEGRSRVGYESGNFSIHTLSHAAIRSVDIQEGTQTPVKVVINMTNTTGMFQIDELLSEKLKGSNIEKYFELTAIVEQGSEKKLMTEFKATF